MPKKQRPEKPQKKDFKGFAAGSGGPPSPPQTAVTGYSTSTATVLGIISEGEIEGPINGLQSVYFDGTPAQNADGSNNFNTLNLNSDGTYNDGSVNSNTFTWDWRSGTQGQSRIPGFADDVEVETNVGVEVKNEVPVTKQIVNNNLDIIRVRVGITLEQYPPSGGVLGSSIEFKIYIQQGSGGMETRLDQTISGRFPTLTEFEYSFSVNNAGGTIEDFSVQVERVTPQDLDTTQWNRVLQWRTYTQCTEIKLAYPNSALIGLQFDSSRFTATPTIAIKAGGKLIQIPSNATPTATRGLTYNGIWDGTFQTPSVAIADPAWILYDLLTNERYGLGRYINTSQVDIWGLYEISQYCNDYVSDGNGSTEHRFQCNVLIDGKTDAYKVIQSLVSVFRGFTYWINGVVGCAADQPGSPIAQFTQSDVEDGIFSYSRSGLKTRHTVALVSWNNKDDFYRQAVEAVEDQDGINKYGVREIEINGFGCTSQGQAHRAGMAALLTDRLEQETVTFKVRAYGAYTKPGDLIQIWDTKRYGARYGGLIVSASTSSVTLDNPVTLLQGTSYALTVMLADGTIQEQSVSNSPGTTSVITVTTNFTSAPPPESNWIISSTTASPQVYRVLNRVPAQGSTEMMHEITASEYDPNKFTQIENGWTLAPLPASRNPPFPPNVPSGIALSYRGFGAIAASGFSLIATWDPPTNSTGQQDPFTSSYYVQYQLGAYGAWSSAENTADTSYQWDGLSAGTYYVRICAVDITGESSFWVVSNPITITIYNDVAVFTTPYTAVFAMEF